MTDQRVEDFYEYVDEAYPEYVNDPRLQGIAVGIVMDMNLEDAFQSAKTQSHMYADMLERAQNQMNKLIAEDREAEERARQEAFNELPFSLNAPKQSLRVRNLKQAKIGAKFSGFKHFKETYYTQISADPKTSVLSDTPTKNLDLYCPENSYCFYRCAEVYQAYKPGFISSKDLKSGLKTIGKINRIGTNPYAAVKTKVLNTVKEAFPDFDINIRYMQLNKKGGYNYPLVNKKKKEANNEYFIGLYPTSIADTYHAILIRSAIKHLLTPDHLKFRMTESLDLTSEWKQVDKSVPASREDLVIVYDIETYSHPLEIRGVIRRLQVPYSISWCIVDVVRDERQNLVATKASKIFNVTARVDDDYLKDLKMYDRFLEQIYVEMAKRYPTKANSAGLEVFDKPVTVQCYAHNGSRFDNLYVKNARTARLIKQVGANSQLKSLKVEYARYLPVQPTKFVKKAHSSNMTVHFKDTYPFVLAPLASLSKRLPITCRKKEFDIADKTKFWFTDNDYARTKKAIKLVIERASDRVTLENGHSVAKSIAYTAFKLNHKLTGRPEDWRDYLKYDIISLACVFEFAERDFNTLGVSMTNACGLPGLAWQMIVKTSFAIQQDQVYYPVHPSMIELCRQATMGGRVICAKSYYKSSSVDDGLICGDANSLYPSAMCNSFPVGRPKLLKKRECNIDKLFASKPHFIVEIEFEIPAKDNSGNEKPFRFIPYREEKTGNLLYPGEGTYTGVYNEVDIAEMIKEGYTVTKVIKGICWERTAAFMKDVVESMYTIRKRLVREGNPSEYVYKIMLNSMYGKFLETIKQTSTFYDAEYDEDLLAMLEPKFKGDKLHPSGQFQHLNYLENYIIKKPTYIGSYVLAFSRRIMNEYIRKIGIENIWYSDTDSIYTTRKAFEESGIEISEELGGIKNDYGEGCFIKEAVFLDQKKYLLRKTRLRGLGKELLEHGPETPSDKPVRYTYEEESTGARFLGIGVTIGDKIAQQVSTRIGEKLGPVAKYNAIRDWFISMMHNGVTVLNDEAGCAKIAREFWKRDTDNVTIFKKEVCVSSNPLKRNELAKKTGLCYHYMSRRTGSVPIRAKPIIPEFVPQTRDGPSFKNYQVISSLHHGRTDLLSCLPIVITDKAKYTEMTKLEDDLDAELIQAIGKEEAKKYIRPRTESGTRVAEWAYGPRLKECFTSYAMDELGNVFYVKRELVKLVPDSVDEDGQTVKGTIPDYVLEEGLKEGNEGQVIRKRFIESESVNVVKYLKTVNYKGEPKFFKEVNVVYEVCKLGPSIRSARFEDKEIESVLHAILFIDAEVADQVSLGTVANTKEIQSIYRSLNNWFD